MELKLPVTLWAFELLILSIKMGLPLLKAGFYWGGGALGLVQESL